MGAALGAKGGGIVVRTFTGEPGARWFAVAEAVPEGIARAAIAGGELPDTAAALEARRRAAWPVETVMADSEAEAVLGAVRRLLARGLRPEEGPGSTWKVRLSRPRGFDGRN